MGIVGWVYSMSRDKIDCLWYDGVVWSEKCGWVMVNIYASNKKLGNIAEFFIMFYYYSLCSSAAAFFAGAFFVGLLTISA
jgi:hypothetical protein